MQVNQDNSYTNVLMYTLQIVTRWKINLRENHIYTLSLDGGKLQNRSSSCDDWASSSKVAALFPQNQPSRAFEPVEKSGKE